MEPRELEPVNGRQAPHHAPDEPRARVIALRGEGYSLRHIGDVTGISVGTVHRWLQRNELEQGNKPILERHARNAVQALDLLRDGLDVIEADETGQLALKHLAQLNFVAGTSTDKLQKDSTPTVSAQNVLIVVNAQKPDEPIDVEARVVDDA